MVTILQSVLERSCISQDKQGCSVVTNSPQKFQCLESKVYFLFFAEFSTDLEVSPGQPSSIC